MLARIMSIKIPVLALLALFLFGCGGGKQITPKAQPIKKRNVVWRSTKNAQPPR